MFSSLGSQIRAKISLKNPMVSVLRSGFMQKNSPNLRFSAAQKKNFSSVYVNHRDTIDNNQNTPFDFTEENYKKIEEILVIN